MWPTGRPAENRTEAAAASRSSEHSKEVSSDRFLWAEEPHEKGGGLILRFEESFTASLSVTSAHCGTYWGVMYGGPEVRVTKQETSVLLGRQELVEPVCPWNQ